MTKDTSKIVEELGLCDSFKRFYDENKDYMITKTLSELLSELLTEQGIKKSEAIKNSELSEIYGYQIFSGKRTPERNKLICLCIGMALNLEQTQLLLKSAGYSPLYVKHPFDSVIIYGICKNMSVIEINELLYEYNLEMLG